MNRLAPSFFVGLEIIVLFSVLAEFLILWKKNKLKAYDKSESIISLKLMMAKNVVTYFQIFAFFEFFKFVFDHRLLDLQWGYWPTFAFAFLAADFSYYLGHRLAHETGIGWAQHIMHHEPKRMNFTVGVRGQVIRPLSTFVLAGYLPTLLGVPFKMQAVAYSFILAEQTFLHTNAVPRLGWVDLVFNTPSNHRVHHGMNPEYINKNYGGIFMIFDHLFGTFAIESPALNIQYGVANPPNSNTFWGIFLMGWKSLYLELRRNKPLRWPAVILGKPNWKAA